ncbi:MAG: UvrD-helicase domain-containing protein [Mobilicoccus sp.]|nr:UvrD-helicase domain-containing protein [Mobilicoccus sp.]
MQTPFDITAPLPTGTVLLEASAGTGKTWTIGKLVTRYVAEGAARLEEMLVVTFGRAASEELRSGVRRALWTTLEALRARDADDPVVRMLLQGTPEQIADAERRLTEALASYDAATITTTHGFCQTVLRSLGVAGDTDRDARLVDEVDDLLGEVVDDLYVRGFAVDAAPPAFDRAEAGRIARTVIDNPQARIEPRDAAPRSDAARRVGFATRVREELAVRMRRGGLLGYDDLLTRLADALAGENSPAAVRMRERWKVVLVDEFQDTDPVQWEVFERAFHGHSTLVLIGDPKQAIYAFRGGDVITYLEAASVADARQSLGRTYRTDGAVLDPLQVILEGTRLGEHDIVVPPIEAHHAGSRLVGAPGASRCRIRVMDRATLGWQGSGLPSIGALRTAVAADVAHEIAELLASGATFDGKPVRPGDVAVLAHTGRQLNEVYEALAARGIPAVLAGGGSVVRTPAAAAWLALLLAMDAPHRTGLVRAAALTDLLGYDAEQIDVGGDVLTDDLARLVRSYADLFAERGLAAVMAALDTLGLSTRLLRREGGERDLTDIRHLAEILHTEAREKRLGLAALIARLRELIEDERRSPSTARRRRLDSDAEAVQLVTIHGSKGLEYVACYVPFLFDRWVPKETAFPAFHLPADEHGRRVRAVDVGGPPPRRDNVAAHLAEEAGESLRLAYVALTRAKGQVVMWWAPTNNARTSPLHRLLVGRSPGQVDVPDEVDIGTDADAIAALRAWEARGGPVVEPARHEGQPPAVTTAEREALDVRRFTRDLDLSWRRTSYSALTRDAGVHALGATSDPEPTVVGVQDEQEAPVASARPVVPGDLPSPMNGLPMGARFGSLVHAVLEEADPRAPDLRAEMLDRIEEFLIDWPLELDEEVLADALVAVCDTPLGSLAPGRTLRDLGRDVRLCEVEFEMPLVGGDVSDPAATPVVLGAIAALLRHHLPEGDPIRGYADALDRAELGGQVLRGYLTGSLDVVLSVDGRYLVADYKTNWLGPYEEDRTAADYAPVLLAEAMGHSDYPLQALLYAVVLHRYLRWRLPGYDPATHLGGVLYLYVRGMCGPDTPLVEGEPCGVFAWQPPPELVCELSDLLDGGAR